MDKGSQELHPSTPEVFAHHRQDTRPPTGRQLRYLFVKCQRHGKTTADLVKEGDCIRSTGRLSRGPNSGTGRA